MTIGKMFGKGSKGMADSEISSVVQTAESQEVQYELEDGSTRSH